MPTQQKSNKYLTFAGGRHQRIEWPGLSGLGGRHQRNTHLGKSAFSRIFGDERMPSLKQTIEIAAKLNMFVEIRARSAGKKGISDRLLAEGKLNRKALMKLVERLALSSEQRHCDIRVKKYRAEKLRLLRHNSSKICWLTLIGYFAACGYDLDVWLTPKDLRSDSDKLIARLDYPL
jgi:hypothetical protein